MKKILHILLAFLLLNGCSKYDDSAVKSNLADLKSRVAALETLCARLNTNIASMQTIAEGLQSGNYLTAVTPIVESGLTIGYRLTYNTGAPIELYNGTEGSNGAAGTNGSNGADGSDGADGAGGTAPSIAITLHEGIYYWSINGILLRDGNGNLIPAVGQDGATGASAVTPQLRINTSTRNWEVSYDSGATWTALGGADGEGETPFFKSIDNSNANYLLLVLSDDSELKIQKVYPINISTSVDSVTVNANASEVINYTLIGEFANAKVETIASEDDWSVIVTPTDTKTGTITITAPDKILSGEILIIAYNGIYSTAMHKVAIQSQAALATITTSPVTDVYTHTAYCGGAVVTTGGAEITERGICWSTSTNPTISDSKYIDARGMNTFIHRIKGLNKNTIYYVRAYAINSVGTVYGNEVSFTTLESYDGIPSDEDGVWQIYAASNFGGGTGTEADPFIISSAEELAKLSNDVNGGNGYSGKYFKLSSEIDLSFKEFTAIGTLSHPFAGIFDGNGHRIIGLYIYQPTVQYLALFGFTSGATIRNLGVIGYVNGSNAVGGIVGESKNSSRVMSCYFAGEVIAPNSAGGIVGHSYIGSRVDNCYNKGRISGTSYSGGIVGSNRSGCTVSNCYNNGTIRGTSNVGGVVGSKDGSVSSSYYLSGSAEYGIGGTTTDDDAKTKKMSDAELKSADAVTGLNGAQTPATWKADNTAPINNGYPILSWQ